MPKRRATGASARDVPAVEHHASRHRATRTRRAAGAWWSSRCRSARAGRGPRRARASATARPRPAAREAAWSAHSSSRNPNRAPLPSVPSPQSSVLQLFPRPPHMLVPVAHPPRALARQQRPVHRHHRHRALHLGDPRRQRIDRQVPPRGQPVHSARRQQQRLRLPDVVDEAPAPPRRAASRGPARSRRRSRRCRSAGKT